MWSSSSVSGGVFWAWCAIREKSDSCTVTPLNITSVSASLRNYLRNWLDDGGEE
jgi:hypothetical protein